MKKSVLALLILLAVLIVTCVYQKTYTIYSTSPKELTLVERDTTAKSTVKTGAVEEKTSTIPVVSVPTPIKPVEVKPLLETKPIVVHKPVLKTEKAAPSAENTTVDVKPVIEPKPTVAHKPVVKTEKPVEKEVKEKSAPSAKGTTPKAVTTEKPSTESTDKPKPVTQNAGEKEIVDYIMWALKNRDIALKNRDEVEARIQELITKALNDRKIVLEERSKNEIALEKLQTELIDARDASYESVINQKTTTQGEK